jgi:hypothetical protein
MNAQGRLAPQPRIMREALIDGILLECSPGFGIQASGIAVRVCRETGPVAEIEKLQITIPAMIGHHHQAETPLPVSAFLSGHRLQPVIILRSIHSHLLQPNAVPLTEVQFARATVCTSYEGRGPATKSMFLRMITG